MTVSVIIPVYNGERYLLEAIQSVIGQTQPASEIIIVDDGSSDGSRAIAYSFSEVTYLSQDNRGTASARNLGIANAKGQFVALLDQDDTWAPNKLELQLAAFDDHPDCSVVFTGVQQFLSPDLAATHSDRFEIPDRPQEGFSPSSMLVRRDVFDRVGGFDETLDQAEWIDWLLRLNESEVKSIVMEDVLCFRRIHAGNKGVVSRHLRGEYLRALKRSVDRRRGTR